MPIQDLSLQHNSLLRKAVEVILVANRAIGNSEFQTRIGMDRHEIRILLDNWDELDDGPNSLFASAINNCSNELLCGIHFTNEQWKKWMKCEPQELIQALNDYRKSQGWPIVIPDSLLSDTRPRLP